MFDSAATIAIIGVLATTVGGLIWVLKYVFSELKPVLDQILVSTKTNTASTEANTVAALEAAKASAEAVRVSSSADEYLRHRNGRDAEMHTELLAGMKEIPNAMNIIAKQSVDTVTKVVEANKNLKEQHVEKQIIEEVQVHHEPA